MAFGPANLDGAGTPPRPMPLASRPAHGAGVLQPLRRRSCWAPGLGGSSPTGSEPVALRLWRSAGLSASGRAGPCGRLVLGHARRRAGRLPLRAVSISTRATGRRRAQHARAHAGGDRLPNAAADQRRGLAATRSRPGLAVVLIEDHINLQGTNPLLGRRRCRRAALRRSDRGLRPARSRAAIARGRGARASRWPMASISPCWGRPSKRRPRSAPTGRSGADLVGMSTVPEAIAPGTPGLASWPPSRS